MAKRRNYNQDFSDRLRKLMDENNITIIALATKLGITRQAVANYLACESMPNINVCADIAAFFDVSTDYLIGKDNQPKATDEALFNEYGLTAETLKKLRTLKEEAIGRDDYAYVLYILNTLIQEENFEKESGLLNALSLYLAFNFKDYAYLLDRESFEKDPVSKKNFRTIAPEDLDTIQMLKLKNVILNFKTAYNLSYRKNEDDAIYLYTNKPNEDGFYYIDKLDRYFKNGRYYYIDSEGYYNLCRADVL